MSPFQNLNASPFNNVQTLNFKTQLAFAFIAAILKSYLRQQTVDSEKQH